MPERSRWTACRYPLGEDGKASFLALTALVGIVADIRAEICTNNFHLDGGGVCAFGLD